MSTIILVKAVYKQAAINRYYVSINGGALKEINAEQFTRYFKQGYTIRSSSESFFDRTMITRELEIL